MNTTSPANLTVGQVKDRLNRANIPLLGRYVWLGRFGSMEVPIDSLVSKWLSAGLDKDQLPDGIRARSGMIRAINKLKEKNLLDHEESGDKSIFSVVIRSGEIGRDYDAKVTFIYNKKAKTVVASDPDFQPLLDGYFRKYQEVFLTKDIRKLVLDTMRTEGCMSLKEDGGIYFLPVSKFGVITRLQEFATSLGQHCRIDYTNVPDTEDDAATLATRAQEEMAADLDKLAEEIGDLINSGKAQNGTLGRRMDELDEQIAKVNMYAQFLAIQGEDLVAKAEASKAKLREKLRA